MPEPLNPHLFFTASEDGTIRQFDLRENSVQSVLVDLRSSRGTIDFYSIALNQMNPCYFATGTRN